MGNLFTEADRQEILGRLRRLGPASSRQWGKMNPAQMLAHCTAALAVATGDLPRKQVLIGKLLSPFVRSSILGEKPFPRNSPTDPAFVISEERDFEKEREGLVAIIHRFAELGADAAAPREHSFLGRLSGMEWGVMMYKHLDHHLRQFGA